jgi:hypothetical protein
VDASEALASLGASQPDGRMGEAGAKGGGAADHARTIHHTSAANTKTTTTSMPTAIDHPPPVRCRGAHTPGSDRKGTGAASWGRVGVSP